MAGNQKELLIFGATGGTGQAIVHTALERGYGITVFVRDIPHAEHLFNGLRSRISFVQGDANNAEDVRRSIDKGLHAVISSLGIFHATPGNDELTRATENILALLPDAGVSRFLCISSLGVGDSRGQGDFMTRMIQKLTLRFTLADKEKQEELIRSSDLAWTLIRPTRLMNGNGPESYQSWTGSAPAGKLNWSINRTDVARFTLDCLDDPSTTGKAYNITGCSK